MSALAQSSYYKRYCAAAKRFELIGGVLLGAGILCDVVFGAPVIAVSVLTAGIGGCLLAIGGASLRPHNVIKSFARQCLQEPSDEFARGLLEALESEKKIRLVASSIQLVEGAVALYSQFDDADPELSSRLQRALEERVVKKMF